MQLFARACDATKEYLANEIEGGILFIVPRSLEVCDSRGLQFVAEICHKCSHPGVQATRQNLKKIASPARDKIARVATALG